MGRKKAENFVVNHNQKLDTDDPENIKKLQKALNFLSQNSDLPVNGENAIEALGQYMDKYNKRQ